MHAGAAGLTWSDVCFWLRLKMTFVIADCLPVFPNNLDDNSLDVSTATVYP